MFTGIIEEIGSIKNITKHSQTMIISINSKKMLEDIHLGDSISVNGVCLTVTQFDQSSFSMDVMPETFRKTNLFQLSAGSKVNLERAMAANGRFGGHIVQGHVDSTGVIKSRENEENSVVFTIEPSTQDIFKYIIPQGSITLDGISLTLVNVTGTTFSVSIIPHTIEETVLQYKFPGDTLNIECDILGKYIHHLMKGNKEQNKTENNISKQLLVENGFI
ncbi:riboflavin synthase [Chengkuizengella axinellae]|uniref:Riboflavin synthase n=1 Tax=Chengkuizengella axinellae TaxID=3064388 RepID=A0ABT9IWP9_9BACL|nr:riboflavin synthase [Chengkuizengella sp. 2205SS18-9]MDP5273747.1 riboflavin synthase [Chengkuizengella sp. 2205SS18-9]